MKQQDQAGAEAPARSSIAIDPVAAVFKARAESAEGLCLTLAAQAREHIATIAALRGEVERLKGEAE